MSNAEPSLLSAAWRYRWWVILVTGVAVGAAAGYLSLQPDESTYRATASVVLQEPVTSDGLVSTEVAGGRFVASQVEIMDSPLVEVEAAELVSATGLEVDADTVAAATEITSSTESPVVTITATHASAEIAVAIANAVADGYRQVSSRQATATAQSQLTQLNAQFDGVEERLVEIDRELAIALAEAARAEAALLEAAGFSRIEAGAREAIELIPDLQEALIEASDEDSEVIRQKIEDYRDRIDLFEQVLSALSEEPAPEPTSLLQEQSTLFSRRAELQSLRDQIAIDAELAPDALALVQEALEASLIGNRETVRTLGVVGVLGLAVGVALAYFIAVSRRSFAGRFEPESILRAPLLADIPDFAEEGLHSTLPVLDHPRSAAAEAYRFAASSLAVSVRSRGIRSLAVVTATQGKGKTTTLINTALAAALDGSSVLIIDFDFGNPEASRLLAKGQTLGAGISDILEGTADIESALFKVDLDYGAALHLLGRGTHPTMAATSLKSDGARVLFKTVADRFDFVFVDSPPLLQVAYSSRIAEIVEGVVVVVEHKSAYREAEDLMGRISLVGTPVVGYIYNRSALRREMTRSKGSTLDIIENNASGDQPSRTRKRRRKAESEGSQS